LEGPEIHHPHARHAGGLPRWLELLIAVTALITSISSIAIALHHGEIMEKLVEASSIPYMQGGFSDVTPEGADVLSLDLLNRGVGPAHQQSLRVKVDGKYVTSLDQLIERSIGPGEPHLGRTVNHVKRRFIPGGESQFVFRLARTPENAVRWDHLQAAQTRWDVEYCYCSVFEECWQVNEQWDEPHPVKQCLRNEAIEFRP